MINDDKRNRLNREKSVSQPLNLEFTVSIIRVEANLRKVYKSKKSLRNDLEQTFKM